MNNKAKRIKKPKPQEIKRTKIEENKINNFDFPLFVECLKVKKKKGEDYNVGHVQFSDYFPFGHKSHVQMLYLKALRLVSLVEKNGPPNFDSVEDTLIDMCVYANQYLKDIKEGKIND